MQVRLHVNSASLVLDGSDKSQVSPGVSLPPNMQL